MCQAVFKICDILKYKQKHFDIQNNWIIGSSNVLHYHILIILSKLFILGNKEKFIVCIYLKNFKFVFRIYQTLHCFMIEKDSWEKQDKEAIDPQDWLFHTITSNILPQLHIPLDESLFDADLILKIQLPTKAQINKQQDSPISAILRNPSQQLSDAYQKAYQQCFPQQKNDRFEKNQPKTKITLNNFICLDRKQNQINKRRIIRDMDENQEQLILNCNYQFNGNIDLFLIKFNAIIYTLQKRCGFKIKSFLTHDVRSRRFIYVFITQTITNMLKVAEKYAIKKEIDYPQIDIFLNDPTGSDDRPLKYNSNVVQKINHLIQEREDFRQQNYKKTKNLIRSLKGLQPKDSYIIEENEPTNSQMKAFIQFEKEHQKLIDQILPKSRSKNKPRNMGQLQNQDQIQLQKIEMLKKIDLTPQQKIYLYEFNRSKMNKGVQKQFINIKRKRQYFAKLSELAYNMGYKVRTHDHLLQNFSLAAKKKSFFDRLRSLLLYKEQIISPYGDLFLFLKAERIKLCYMALKQYIRIEHLKSISAQLFALHNDFDKEGTLGQIFDQRPPIESIKGGLNGKNLVDSWSIFTPWRFNLLTLKNYLGERTTYQVYVKNHLILHFFVISPLAIGAEVLRKFYLENYIIKKGDYLVQFIYYSVFFTISHILFCIFYELWIQKQNYFIENYTQKEVVNNFRYDFSGPFVRNPITDSVNQHQLTLTLFTRFKQLLFLFILSCILGAQMGAFYGIRLLIVDIYSNFPEIDYYIISPPHLIPYFIFFFFNHFFYYFIIGNLIKKMTQWENLPTETAFVKSFNSKSYFFLLFLQLIGPIFLLFIEPLSRNNCYSQFCYTQFKLYIYSRHVIIFFFIICKAVVTFYLQIKSRFQKQKQKQHQLGHIGHRYQIADYFGKMAYFLGFVQSQSEKQDMQMNMIDETLSLFYHGIFMASFPLSCVFALIRMVIDYAVQRTELLHLRRRTFGQQQKISLYSYKYNMVLHMSILINCWILFFTLEDVEYQFQKLIEALQYPPYYSTIITIKIIMMIVAVLLFEIIAFIIKIIVKSNSMYEMHQRQTNKYNEYIKRALTLNSKTHIVIKQPYPIKYIFRTAREPKIQKFPQEKIGSYQSRTDINQYQFKSFTNFG